MSEEWQRERDFWLAQKVETFDLQYTSQYSEHRDLVKEETTEMEAQGYCYGEDALEQVRFGWGLARRAKAGGA